jgi:tetratricopeptide (TPR) repeat protein
MDAGQDRTFRIFLVRVWAITLVVMIVASCSPEAKKSRLSEDAERYFKAGEYDKAKIEYLNLLRADQQNAIAFQRLGVIWFEEGAPLRAGPFLFKARELAPSNIDCRTKLTRVFISVGQLAEAQKEAISILEQSPGNGGAIMLLAEAARTKEELAVVEQQLQTFPEHDSVSFRLASANLFAARGDLASAQNELRRAVTVDPKSSSAHLAMAAFYFSQKNPTQGGEELKIGADLSSARSTERLKYAEFKAQTGAADEAKVMLQAITRQAPDYLPAWCLLAQIAFVERNYDEALALLENVIGRDSENLDAQRLQGGVWLAKGEAKKAIECFEGLDRTYPNLPVIKYQLACAYLQNNNVTEAAVALNYAISINPDYTDAVLLLGSLDLRLGDPQPVIVAMNDLLKKQPNSVSAQLLLGEAYEASGRLDDAADVYREQIKLSPRSSQPQLLLGLILRQQKKDDEARKAFTKALELAPEDLAPIEQLVELDISSKNFDSAMARIDQQIEQKPNSAGLRFIQGKIYAARGDWDRAETTLLQTLALDANFQSAYNLLISTYVATDRLPQAIKQLEALLVKSPGDPRSLMTLGLVYEKMKDFSKARETYETLLSASPDFAPALNDLAYLYAEQLHQLDRAHDLAYKARALQPGDAVIADTLGWILYKRAEYQKAFTLLRESAGKLQDNSEIQFHLGMASYMMGESNSAQKAFQRALSAGTDFSGKTEAERRLKFLESGPEAPEQLETLATQQQNDVIALMRLGASYENKGEFAKAAGAYEGALKSNPELLSAAVKVAQLNLGPLQNKNKNKAFEFAKRARDLAPSDPQVAGVLGESAYQLGNFKWAYSLLQESSRQTTSDPNVLHDYAWSAYSLGQVNDAQRIMQRLLEAHPNTRQAEDAKSFLAMTALEQHPEHLATSEPEIQRVLATDATYVPALIAQADLHVQRGNAKSAATIYNDVLRRYPDFASAQKRLASLYLEDPARIDEAYGLALKARNTLPEDPELAQILGELSYKRKEFAYAIRSFQESARKKPLEAKFLYYLGMCQLETMQSYQGRKSLQQALTAGLQEPFATEAKHMLAESNPR